MNYEAIKDYINAIELIYEGTTEQLVESEVNLPEYYCDVTKVLKCTVNPIILTTQITGERVIVEGNAKICFIILGEDNSVYSYESTYPFSKNIEVRDLSEKSSVIAFANTEYISCRAESQRKISANANINISIKIYSLKTIEIVTDSNISGIQLKKTEKNPYSIVKREQKFFTVNEIFELTKEVSTIKRLIRSDATVYLNEIKTINNKMMVTGEIQIKSLFIKDDNETDMISLANIANFNQIFEISEIDEDSISDVSLNINSIDSEIKSDASGAANAIDYKLKVSAVITTGNVKNINCVTDAYSTEKEIDVNIKKCDFSILREKLNEQIVFKTTVDIKDAEIDRIVDVFVANVRKSIHVENGEFCIIGSLDVSILYSYADGRLNYTERSVDFEEKRKIDVSYGDIRFEPTVCIAGYNYSHVASEQLDLKIELNVSGFLFSIEELTIVDTINEIGESIKQKNSAYLIIYFSDIGESVWDIARKYNTTVERIIDENKLTEDIIKEKIMLLIPCDN